MKFFVYRENSILNNGFVRTINALCLFCLVVLAPFSGVTQLEFSLAVLVIVLIVSSLLCAYATDRVLSNTEFFEWDYTERQKKKRFTLTYIAICEIISSMFVFSIIIAYHAISDLGMSMFSITFFITPILVFAFNLCNIVSLFYPAFKDDLMMAYKIQKKPKNWQDNGREIHNEDEIEEILHRDFNI